MSAPDPLPARLLPDLTLLSGRFERGRAVRVAGGRIDEPEMRTWWAFLDEHWLSYLNWSIADKEETAAALRPGTSPAGGWTEDALSESGRLVRGHLRARHAARA